MYYKNLSILMKNYIVGAVIALGLVVSPSFTQAAGLTDSQVQAILSLLSSFGANQLVIDNVNTALTGGTSSTGGDFCYNFKNDLTFGVAGGNDIHNLYLALKLPFPTEGMVTFDEDTAAAVVRFQAKHGIRQTGYVGPLTRAKLNSLYGCNDVNPPQTSSLTVTKYSGFGDQTVVAGTANARIGSFKFTVNSPNGMNITQIGLPLTGASNVRNLVIKEHNLGIQIGSTIATPSSYNTITVPSNFVTAPIGYSETTYDIYGDIPTNASGTIQASASIFGTDLVSGVSYSSSDKGAITLQNVTIGTSSLIVARGSSEPTSRNITMGDSSVPIGQFKFSALNSAHTVQNVKILVPNNVSNSVTAVMVRYRDVNGSMQTATQALTSNLGYTYAIAYFSGLTMYVPANGSANLDVLINTATVAMGGTPGAIVRAEFDTSGFNAVDSSGTVLTQINGGVNITAGGMFTLTNLATPAPTLPDLYFSGNVIDTASAPANSFAINLCNKGARLTQVSTLGSILLNVAANGITRGGMGYGASIESNQCVKIGYYKYSDFGMTAGSSYQITITADSAQKYQEADENNNVVVAPFSISATTAPAITVTSPNGGETWQAGSVHRVSWSNNTGKNVRIELIKGNNYITDWGSLSSLSSGYDITLSSSLQVGSDYKIRIASLDSSGGANYVYYDDSDNYFTITNSTIPTPAPTTLSVDLKVNGSDSPSAIPYDSTFAASWTSTGAINCSASGHYVPVSDGGLWTDLSNLPTSGSKTLTARHNTYGYITPLQLTVQCINGNNASISDTVYVPVTQNLAPIITVLSPNGGEVWQKGPTNYPVTWKWTSSIAKFNMYLINPNTGGRIAQVGVGVDVGEGKTYIGIADVPANAFIVPGSYKLEICDASNDGLVCDSSDVAFSIVAATPAPTVTLTANPASVNYGQSTTLTWSSTNANSCSVDPLFEGNATSKVVSASPTQTTTYTATCTGAGGSTSKSVTVAVATSQELSSSALKISYSNMDKSGAYRRFYDPKIVYNGQIFDYYIHYSDSGAFCKLYGTSVYGPSSSMSTSATSGWNVEGDSGKFYLRNGAYTPLLTAQCGDIGVPSSSILGLIGGASSMANALGALDSLAANNSGSQTQTGFSYNWSRDLQIGSPYLEDVKSLQTALTKEGVYSGEITGGFYNQTYWAVQAFQQKYGINSTGYVGALTREKLNS
ncbi:MAG: peptidoglycan-binding domain-containing protein, partial [bacterium]